MSLSRVSSAEISLDSQMKNLMHKNKYKKISLFNIRGREYPQNSSHRTAVPFGLGCGNENDFCFVFYRFLYIQQTYKRIIHIYIYM